MVKGTLQTSSGPKEIFYVVKTKLRRIVEASKIINAREDHVPTDGRTKKNRGSGLMCRSVHGHRRVRRLKPQQMNRTKLNQMNLVGSPFVQTTASRFYALHSSSGKRIKSSYQMNHTQRRFPLDLKT